ncbi:MAG: hypothetical protein KDM91_21075 [Verrucomicrobiae bacterium]|nr:hypothetical protein [Verrucomicrobiae bacterium]
MIPNSPFRIVRFLSVLAIASGLAAVPRAGNAQGGAPQKIDIGNLPADVVDDVIIPIPQEIFASLDKLGNQNWKSHLLRKDVDLDANRSRTAFLFGLVISEGFIAVQAEDRDEVKRAGREVLRLAGALGVKSEVEGHALAIIDGANAGEWSGVRRELDRTRQTVIDTMEKQRDKEFADLVSIGGWLGGTRALAALVSDRYSADAAELLHQPDLLDQISRRFAGLSDRARIGAIFERVTQTLDALKPLMRTNGDGNVPAEAVGKIESLTTDLTNAVYGN